MERPDINKLPFDGEADFVLVGKASSYDEAERIAGQYRARGFETRIIRRSKAGITLFEVWAGKKPDILSAK